MRKFLWTLCLSISVCIHAFAQQFVSADNPNIHYCGRVSFKNPQSPCMVYPGSMIQVNFTGTSIQMKAKPNSGFFMVTIDNKPACKINFQKTDSILTLSKDLENGSHSAEIMLIYEGFQNRPEFRGFVLDDKAMVLPYITTKKHKIEFIGNSITCAYGIEAASEKEHFSNETQNFYDCYAQITARALNAEAMVVARSGIGMYRNYNGNIKGDKNIMPRWYDYTLYYDSTEVWNPARYTPEIICINLGTNDFSTNHYDKNLYKANYQKFLFHLRSLYPKAKIVMLTGSMMSGKPLLELKQILDELQQEYLSAGDMNLYRFDFTPIDGSLGYGADFHPSKAQHAKMAQELTPFLTKLIN